MEQKFYRMRCLGFVAYCDAFIGRRNIDTGFDVYSAFLISIIGTVSNVKTVSANLYSGEQARLTEFSDNNEYSGIGCRYYGEVNSTNIHTIRTRKVGDIINKIVVHRFVLGAQNDKAAVVFGPDLPTVQERAFLRLDSATTIPLKKQWMSWLWDEVMQPEQLYSFGDSELRYAYLVSLPTDEELEILVLQAVKEKYLN